MKSYKDARLANRGGDLKKTWYLSYYYMIPGTAKFKRFKITGDINRFKTKTERTEAGRLAVFQTNKMLREGYNPFSETLTPIANAEMTFQDAINYFTEHHVNNTGDRSKQNYRWVFRMLLPVIGADAPINTIKPNEIRDALAKIQREHNHANRTRNNNLQLLAALFKFLCNDQDVRLRENPCRYVSELPVTTEPVQNIPPTDEEFKLICDHLYKTDKNLLLAMLFVLYLSMRTTELGKVQRSQLTLYKGQLALTLKGVNVKNKKARLQLIPPDMERLMNELGIQELEPDTYIFGYGMKPGKKQWSSFRNRASEIWKRKVKDVLHVQCGLYSNKHYQATALALNGVDTRLIQKWADHQDEKVTKNYIRGSIPLVPIEMMDELVKMPFYEHNEKETQPELLAELKGLLETFKVNKKATAQQLKEASEVLQKLEAASQTV